MSTQAPPGSLASWLRDSACAGCAMAVGALLPVYIDKLSRIGPEWLDAMVFGTTAATGLLVGALSSIALWAFARLTWRTGPLLSMASGPVAGALSAGILFVSVLYAIDGRVPRLTLAQGALVLGCGAFALGPPWVAYVAVRAKGRSGLWIALGAGLWATVPMALLLVSVEALGLL